MPIKYSQAVREDVATRLSGGQTPKQISETLNLSLKTVYRLKKSFILDGSAYISPPMGKTVREKINREKLIQLSEIMQRNANTTLKELMAQAVVEKVFESTETAPYKKGRLQVAGSKIRRPASSSDESHLRTVRVSPISSRGLS